MHLFNAAIRTIAIGVAGTCLLAGAAQATIITLDLNSLTPGTLSGPITVDGFTITPSGSSGTKIVNVAGTNALESTDSTFAGGTGDVLTMANGGTFSLVSVALAALGGDTGYGINVLNNVTNTGLQYGVYNHNSATYAGPLSTSFTTYDYSALTTFQNSTAFRLGIVDQNNGEAIQSITVSYTPAPEPASVAILGSGLAGLGWLRRRRQAV